eukprot:7543595-Pyramimonas_sp.AAC.1
MRVLPAPGDLRPPPRFCPRAQGRPSGKPSATSAHPSERARKRLVPGGLGPRSEAGFAVDIGDAEAVGDVSMSHGPPLPGG